MDNTFMLYSALLRRFKNSDKITPEDIKNMINGEVNNAAIELYKNVINWISEGKSIGEIYYLIDKYNVMEFDTLLEDQKTYIKTRIKKDLKIRNDKER